MTWPPGCDRRALVDARLGTHLALWNERLSRWFVSGRPEATWLSDRVLQIRAAAVTFWAVLTESEVTVFWEAPLAVRLLVTQSRRDAMVATLRNDIMATESGAADGTVLSLP
jgi:hypothetical protein